MYPDNFKFVGDSKYRAVVLSNLFTQSIIMSQHLSVLCLC